MVQKAPHNLTGTSMIGRANGRRERMLMGAIPVLPGNPAIQFHSNQLNRRPHFDTLPFKIMSICNPLPEAYTPRCISRLIYQILFALAVLAVVHSFRCQSKRAAHTR